MSILHEILVWSQSLPGWQSDAIGRLFVKQTLSKDDIEDLYALLKSEYGIKDHKNRIPRRLRTDQVPAPPSTGRPVELLAIKNLQNVNAIAENQRLSFGEKGLTIIYGDNGSGKSGYSRVLKRACRARDQSEPIHPRATLPASQSGTPQAVFEVSLDGNIADLTWIDGQPSPVELSTIAIFDSRCARSYLDVEDDFGYVPYGLDILKGLAEVCTELGSLIKAELSQTSPDTSSFDDLTGQGTLVSNLIAGLSPKTKPEKVEALAKLSDKELARRNQLDQSLRTDNPLDKAAQLRLLSTRINKLTMTVEQKAAVVSDENVTRLQSFAENNFNAREAAKLAAQTFREDANLLPGTGSDSWKELFEAGRKFYRESVQSNDSEFNSETPCPLCQQPLGDAASRLNRFERFVQDETEKNARRALTEFDEELKHFISQTPVLGLETELETELEAKVAGLGKMVRGYEQALIERHKSIVEACNSGIWNEIQVLPVGPAVQLDELATGLNKEVTRLEAAADETARAQMESEFRELDARMKLSKVKTAVVTAITNMDLELRLNKCLKAIKTTAISKKAKELAETVISKDLEVALNREFKALSADNLTVSLQSRSAKGKTLHKLKLGLSQAKSPREVLSEGEQRAIAIGSFLAEVNLGGGAGAVVFDDPVSSLDHKRREKVATRLVQEALKRQVIVFTHDVYFVSILVDEAKDKGTVCLTQSLTRKPEGFGVADPRLPFRAMNTKGRVAELRDLQQKIGKVFKDGDEQEHMKQTFEAYHQLRFAWERAVEEVLLRDVIRRFRKGVSTQSLAGVTVEDSDYVAINRGMTKCSNYAHDQALLGGLAVPDPDELLADINALEEWRKQVENRSKELTKHRKAGGQ